jgi:hypothetical protein
VAALLVSDLEQHSKREKSYGQTEEASKSATEKAS